MAAEKNRLHQILTDGGLRPDVVVSDVQGTAARKMVKALTAGTSIHDVLTLAASISRSAARSCSTLWGTN